MSVDVDTSRGTRTLRGVPRDSNRPEGSRSRCAVPAVGTDKVGRSMTVPKQKPHESAQAVLTPPDFLAAVEKRFGPIKLDAAASAPNVCPWHFGPGGLAPDGLAVDWLIGGLVWVNPPFRDCGVWAQKCAAEARRGVFSVLLTPISLETRWFEAVEHECQALVLRPRLKFVGHEHDYPKGLLLSVFGGGTRGVIEPWRWKP